MMKIGEKLKSAREAKWLSVYEISMTLKINAKVLIALEADDFQNPILPSRIFIRGFIKSYSQLLKLNPEEFLQEFDQGGDPKKVPTSIKQGENLEKEQFLEEPELPWKKILVLIIVLVVLIIVITIARTLSVGSPTVMPNEVSTTLEIPVETSTTLPPIDVAVATAASTTTLIETSSAAANSTTTSTSSTTTTSTSTTLAPSTITEVVIEASGDLKILYAFSDQELKEITLGTGQIHRFKVKSKIRLEISNSAFAIVYVNGLKKDSPSAPPGQPLKLEIP